MQLFRAIRLILTLRCEQSTQLVSASLENELTFAERWAVRLHAISCWSCRRFRRQILFLREAMRHPDFSSQIESLSGQVLSLDAKERIRQRVISDLNERAD